MNIWYEDLIEDLKGTITEGVFNSRDVLIECYHQVGQKLREASQNEDVPITDLVQDCAVDLKVSHRKLWYAVKFFDKFPDRSLVPFGKNASWHKIQKLLTDSTDKPECEHDFQKIDVCTKCGKRR